MFNAGHNRLIQRAVQRRQIKRMRRFVGELVVIVGGSKKNGASQQHRTITEQETAGTMMGPSFQRAIAAPAKRARSKVAKEIAVPKLNEVKPDEVVPMDEAEEFKDFYQQYFMRQRARQILLPAYELSDTRQGESP